MLAEGGRDRPDRAGLFVELDRDAEVRLPVGELDAHLARLEVVAAHCFGETLDGGPAAVDVGEEALPLGERSGKERRREEVAHGVLAAPWRQLAEREQVGP